MSIDAKYAKTIIKYDYQSVVLLLINSCITKNKVMDVFNVSEDEVPIIREALARSVRFLKDEIKESKCH